MKRLLALVAAAVVAAGLPAAAAQARGASLAPVLSTGDWINGRPDAAALRGKVVLVDVFTFACYNCKNITPNLRRLHAQTPSRDLAILGVHAPETSYEKDRANVVTNLKSLGIVWPVRTDNDFAVWHAYGVEYWPTQLIFDRHGVLRKTVIGDSQDAEVDSTIAELISEN
jgi:thiol-disulfide isomerase/thioredoxin